MKDFIEHVDCNSKQQVTEACTGDRYQCGGMNIKQVLVKYWIKTAYYVHDHNLIQYLDSDDWALWNTFNV